MTDNGELRAAHRRTIEAADAARGRLARDLHDGAQQQFVIAVINLQLAQQAFDKDVRRAKELLDIGLAQASAGLATLRELVAGIHPPILTHMGLLAAVEALVAAVPLPVSVDILEERLPAAVEASLYFFISEAITNVVKHANATTGTVSVTLEDALVTVVVADNGIGGAGLTVMGSGLSGLDDRVSALDGRLEITSPAGGPTSLWAQIPVHAA